MKTFIKLTLCILISIFFLSGCSNQAKNEKTTIEFWTLQLSDFSPYMNSLIAEYEKTHPNIKIKWIDVPFSEGEKRVLASIMSNHVPDLVNLNPSFSSTLSSKGTLSDISTYSTKKDFDDFLNPAMNLCRQNEKIYCIPWYITSSITLYNAELIKKAEITKLPQKDEELYAFAKQVKTKTGKYALMPTLSEDGYMMKNLVKHNVKIIDEKTEQVSLNTLEVLKIYKIWTDLYSSNYIPKESITQTHREALEKYMSGELAMLQTGANFLLMIKDNAPDVHKKTKLAPQMNLENGVVDFSMMNLIIPQKAKNKKEALEFALFLTNEKNQLEFSKLAPVLPSSKKALNNDFFNSDTTLIEQGRKISAYQMKIGEKNIPLYPQQKEINTIIDYTTQEIILKKETPQNALKEAEEKIKHILFK